MTAGQLLHLCEAIGVEGLTPRHTNITGLCPIHHERRPSWGISTTKQFHPWNCYSCGAKGTLIWLVQKVMATTKERALEFIGKFGSYTVPEFTGDIPEFERRWMNEEVQFTPASLFRPFEVHQKKAGFWLVKRGVSLAVAGDCRLGYDPKQDRVIYPWWEDGGKRLHGMTGRARKSLVEPKTLPYFGFKRGLALFRPLTCESKTREPLIVTEGELDALKVASFGYPNVVSTGGAPSRKQADLMVDYGQRVVLMFDNDPGGEQMITTVDGWIGRRTRLFKVDYPEGVKDPADMTEDQFQGSLKSARLVGL